MSSQFYLYSGIISGIFSVISFANYYTLTSAYLISTEYAKNKIASGEIQLVVDVRTKNEYNNGHYPNSKHLPFNQIDENTTKDISKNIGILVYCRTGRRAKKAVEKLKSLGFNNIFYITSKYNTII